MKKILIVDDSYIIRDLCQRVLERNNFITELAQSAEEALEIIDDTFSLIISD